MFGRKKEDRGNKILLLIDFENLQKNARIAQTPDNFSITDAFDSLFRQISQETGKITDAFIFVPPHTTSLLIEKFYELGLFTIFCPKVIDKGKEKDTVDSTMIEFGRKMINQMPELTHLCLGSGDKDFIPLIREAMRAGLKIMIIAGDQLSLSSEIIKLADFNPKTKQKMIYLFSPSPTGG